MFSSALVLWFAGHAGAHNNLFLPGDAYFSAELREGFFEGKREGGDLAFEYHRYVGEFMACGWAGYENLVVKEVPGAIMANLRQVHRVLWKEFSPRARAGAELGGGEAGEEKGFPIFIYNRSFPLSSPIGVKYNEDWAVVQTGEAKMPHPIYDDLGGIDFVIDDWASARDIAPLAIAAGRAPMVTEEGETGIVRKPLEIMANDVMFVVLAEGDVGGYARREQGLVFFVVTGEVRRFRFNRQGVAMPQKLEAAADDVAEKRREIAADQAALRSALAVYALNHSGLPTRGQGLRALVEKPSADAPSEWMPVLRNPDRLLDPWGHPYQWDGEVIFSFGADGIESQDDVVEPFSLGTDDAPAPRGER